MIKIKDGEVRPGGCMGHVRIYRQIVGICEAGSDISCLMEKEVEDNERRILPFE